MIQESLVQELCMHESPEAVSDFVSALATVQDFFVYMQFQLFSATLVRQEC